MSMSSDTISEQRLAELLMSLGETADQVAAALRRAKIVGRQSSAYQCPLARYIAERTRQLVPSARINVRVCAGEVAVEIHQPDTDEYQEITVAQPKAAKDFVKSFDEGGYADLVDASAA
ncbi:hypothetical protein [Actinomadura miaoliensis]|uniref:Uncharacterized protein n=1 Tax=Actinomadura miaoliensis TaxID=430685 RepID=A0ABP7WZT2_9ACTN